MATFSQKRHNNVPTCLPGFESINRYWDNMHDSFAAKILPGEFYVTNGDEIIVTVLGSCVSACIRDPVSGIGGMNHFMLPYKGRDMTVLEDVTSEATRYGNYAMEHMINEVLKNGGMRKRLEVKIFGGGRVLKSMTDIGKKNIEFVEQYLEQENLLILSRCLGDIYPRKVIYIPKTGKVLVKKLRSIHNDTILQREEKYLQQFKEKPIVSGEVELF